jgi:heavy metal translocating P-type ATPase
MRVHMMKRRMTLEQADILEYYLRSIGGVTRVTVFDRTCDAVIVYTGARQEVITALAAFSETDEAAKALVPDHTGRAMQREFEDRLAGVILRRYLRKLFLPAPLRYIYCVCRAAGYVLQGLRCLLRGRLEVPVLDATAITVSLLRGDFDTASSVMFLLHIGEILEDWTHKKSVADLARTMSLNVDKVWMKTGDQEILVPLNKVRVGDRIVVRAGSMIPLDGRVTEGEAMVNQASMTGESAPVRKHEGSLVYAGTVLEEGACTILVEKDSGSGRYDRIVRMIEESEKLKSDTEDKASHLADRLVPYSLGGTILAYLLTSNVTKALSILMVDFSCALKLAMPIAVLSAMRECSTHHISVKGGKFMEAVAAADTIVFDKTGTLTHAQPHVAKVVPFHGEDPAEMLRLAACLEEHYPHSIANAVVEEAARRGLLHEERHTQVEYIVAHGISSRIDSKKAIIGSYHFVFEDEACVIPEGEQETFDALPDELSHLYLAIDGVLSAVLCIEDPLRAEARDVVHRLHELGFSKVVMMTGDNARTARVVAGAVGVDDYYAEVLPEDKADFIRREREAGRTVVMIGDGINDSPALSESNAGIAISTGAAIAREIADITISADDLTALVTLKRACDALMGRIHDNYRFIISFNLMLIGLGLLGVLPPATSALLHNASTIGIGLRSMTNLLEA